MTLLLTTLPEDRTELAQTLERFLVGPNLDDLVEELSALHGAVSPEITLADLLNDDRGSVLLRGLATLYLKKLRCLLRNPSLLIELHELVLLEGGPHWDQLLQRQTDIRDIVERAGRRLEASLGLSDAPRPLPPRQPRRRFYPRPWFVSLSTAAVVLLAVYFVNQYWESRRVWGWNRPDLLANANSPKEVFTRLANAGEEFQKQVKDSPGDLDKALHAMREGCLRLRSEAFPQLSQKDRTWLQRVCKEWGEEIDQHLVDLKSGKKPWQTVREEANQTVDKLVKTLRDRPVNSVAGRWSTYVPF
jgi:hypothetical protein